MPQRSKVSQMPQSVQDEFRRRLVANAFSDYDGIADWLQSEGYEISRTSAAREGKKFQEQLEALRVSTEEAKQVVEASPDDEGAMNEALIRLIQGKTFAILKELNDDDAVSHLSKIGRMVAELARASVSQKKWAAQVREKAADAADSIADIAQKAGLSDNTIKQFRERVMGIAG